MAFPYTIKMQNVLVQNSTKSHSEYIAGRFLNFGVGYLYPITVQCTSAVRRPPALMWPLTIREEKRK